MQGINILEIKKDENHDTSLVGINKLTIFM